VPALIASKAGLKHLFVRHRGDTVLRLLGQLRGKVQYNGSIGIMPEYLRNAPGAQRRHLRAASRVLQACQSMGLAAESVLAQP